jgi:hypothetical protein
LVLHVAGDPRTINPKDWEDFKGEWRDAMKTATESAGLGFVYQDGEGKPDGEAGTLVLVHINDYRYLSAGARWAWGIFVANAYVDATVKFIDAKSGAELGEKTYNTTSHVRRASCPR